MATARTVNLVPHQKLIVVNKAESNKKNLYCILNLESLNRACNALQTKAGIKLFLYLAKNQNKYSFALSSKDFEEWAAVGKTAYDSAIRELIDKGYLVKRDESKEIYDFYENGKIIDNSVKKAKKEDKNNSSFVF